PAPVIGHRLAAELAGDGLASRRLEVRIVYHDHGDLALEVGALEIVPASLRRGDAITNEHHRSVRDAGMIDRPHRAEVDIVGKSKRGFRRALANRKARRAKPGADHWDGLRPPPILAARLQASGLELPNQIIDRSLFARGPHGSALKLV